MIEASLGTESDPRRVVLYILHAVQHHSPILHVTPTSLAPILVEFVEFGHEDGTADVSMPGIGSCL
jgi:hypothetical protein